MRFDNIDCKKAYWILEHFPAMLIDVREEEEYQKFHLRNAINIPYEELSQKTFDPGLAYIFYCSHGLQSMRAARDFAMDGFRAYNITGGLNALDKDIDIV